MRAPKALLWPLAVTVPLTACAHATKPPRPLPQAPFAYLSLTACRNYPGKIIECQLDYGAGFARQRLGPVQQASRNLAMRSQYQISSCWPADRFRPELPNFTCRIYDGPTDADSGSVLIKGGTAVRLARILGDREQIGYRWTPDKWSRVAD